ncbi:MAG TPA: permease-like cell division protein FtsX, partial [Methylomirabilota bacterium]|nr:permease-like cell division protein FtsX [Methylomirabilota bacterium]
LEDGLRPGEVERLLAEVAAIDGVAAVNYVSPEEAWERLEAAFAERGETLDTGGAEIQLQATLEISLTETDLARSVSLALTDVSEVTKVTTRQQEVDTLVGIITVIRTAGLVAVGLVGLTVLFMIINTIRIAVYSRAGEIEIMRLVGASDSFIRWPFILEGILCGLIGAFITIALVATVWEPIQPVMVAVFQMPTAVSRQFLTTLSLLLLAVGFGVGAAGSWISVRSYLSAIR